MTSNRMSEDSNVFHPHTSRLGAAHRTSVTTYLPSRYLFPNCASRLYPTPIHLQEAKRRREREKHDPGPQTRCSSEVLFFKHELNFGAVRSHPSAPYGTPCGICRQTRRRDTNCQPSGAHHTPATTPLLRIRLGGMRSRDSACRSEDGEGKLTRSLRGSLLCETSSFLHVEVWTRTRCNTGVTWVI